MKRVNKVTEDIDVIGSSKLTASKIKSIVSFVLMVAVFIIGFNFRINTVNNIDPTVEEIPSVTTKETMTTTTMATTTTTMITSSSTSVTTTTPVTTTEVEEVTTTEEEYIITVPVNIEVYVEPTHEEPPVIVEEEPTIEEEETSTEESTTDPPVEEPVVEEETEPDFGNMTYLGNLRITGYVATGNPTATGVYPFVGGVAMSRSYGIPYGSTIYIDGLGYFELNDTGCAYGVVDVFRNTIAECYDLTSYADVYVVN